MNKDERINLTPAQQMDQPGPRAAEQLEPRKLDSQNQLKQQLLLHQHQQGSEVRQSRQKRNQVQYQLKQVIGKGSYGIVYKAINKKTQQIVAIKEVNYENDDELTDIMSEIDLLKNLNHINIVKYHGFIQKSHNLYIILEYCSHGSLKNLISRGNGLEEMKAKIYVTQTLNGLHYLHEQGVIHRDIKAANLLLDSDNVVKLADFGVSTQVSTIMMAMTLAGSLNWMAPEIITNRGATTLSDIWSLGATVLELLTGNPPFHNLVDLNIYYAIENDSFIPPNFLSPLAQDFLLSCFQKNMYKRPTALQLLKHKWLNNKNELNKLDQFKEINTDYQWDQDFKEMDIIDKKDIKSSSDKTAMPILMQTRSDLSQTEFASTKRDLFSDIVDDKAVSETQLAFFFNDLSPQDLALKLIKIAEKHSDLNTNYNTFLEAVFEYDRNLNDSKVKQYFITFGGISTILNNNSLIEQFFIKDSFKTLIHSGIMLNHNLKKLDNSLQFEIILRFLEVANSKEFWCNWCSENLKIATLLEKDNLSNKFFQNIVLKLSFFDDTSLWFPQQFISNLLKIEPLKENFDQQSLSVVFKALSSILIQSHKNTLSSPIIPSSSSSLALSTSSLSPSSSPSLISAQSSSAKANLINNNKVRDIPVSSFNLPPNFLAWLLAFLNDPPFFHMKNLHAWKYYVIVIYHATHLNKFLIKNLIADQKFSQLILSFLSHCHYENYYQNEECLLPIVHQSLSIIIEMSNELKKFDSIYLELSLHFLHFDEDCITGGLEILFNCLQLSLHDNNKIYSRDAKNLSISFHVPSESGITLHCYQLVDAFYNIRKDNVQFGNFISKFMKICSLAPLDFVSFKILSHSNFIERCVTFFQLYRNSLLIQIDLLKFVKLIFLRSFEFNFKDNYADKDASRMIQSKLRDIVDFLSNNWTSYETGQVGHDSILIHQLCHDIEGIISTSVSALSTASLMPTSATMAELDKDGFAVPKLPQPSSSF